VMVNGEEKAAAEERRRVVKKCSREVEKMDGWRSVVRSWSRMEPSGWRGAPAHSGASGLLPGPRNYNCASAGQVLIGSDRPPGVQLQRLNCANQTSWYCFRDNSCKVSQASQTTVRRRRRVC